MSKNYTPAEVIEVFEKIEYMSAKELIKNGFIKFSAVLGEGSQDTHAVVLDAVGDRKILVIKEIRAATSLSLAEAKEITDRVGNGYDAFPETVYTTDRATADRVVANLRSVGAQAHIKHV